MDQKQGGYMIKFLTGLLPGLFEIIDKAVTDKDEAAKIKATLQAQILSNESTLLTKQAEIVVAEIKQGGPSSTWRPHLMYLLMGLLVFNGVVVPIADGVFGYELPVLEAWDAIPEKMWTLLMIGMGGYIVGRSGEKIAEHIKS